MDDAPPPDFGSSVRWSPRVGSRSEIHTRQSLDENTREVRRLADVLRHQAAVAQRADIGLPDPNTATTSAEFVELMRDLVAWSGMTRRRLEEMAGPGKLPKSTLDDALKRDSLPRLEVVKALTWAVRLMPEEAQAWELAWRRLRPQDQRSRRAPAVDGHAASVVDAEKSVDDADETANITQEVKAETTTNTEPPQPVRKPRRNLFRRGQRDA